MANMYSNCVGPRCRFVREAENSTLTISAQNSTLPFNSTILEVNQGKTSEIGTPVMSTEQINLMAHVILQALQSQDCLQRLMCETGAEAKTLSWTEAIADLIVARVPKSGVSTYLIFKEGKNCERFNCQPTQQDL